MMINLIGTLLVQLFLMVVITGIPCLIIWLMNRGGAEKKLEEIREKFNELDDWVQENIND